MNNVALYAMHIGPPGLTPVAESVAIVLAARWAPTAQVVISMLGFDDDRRELWEIPEACDYLRQVLTEVLDADPVFYSNLMSERISLETRMWIGLCALTPKH